MIYLGIDSSNTSATVAIATEDKLIAEFTLDNKLTHSQKLMPMIENIFRETGYKAEDVDVFAVSIGPGSFTGLRIGVATAKALAYAVEKEIVGVSSLEVLAKNIKYFDGLIVPVMDARNKRVFASVYYKDENVVEESAFDLEELLSIIDEYKLKAIFIGNGTVYRDIISERLGEKAVFASIKDNLSRASSVCELAIEKAEKGHFDNVKTIVPNYLRESQAERQKRENK